MFFLSISYMYNILFVFRERNGNVIVENKKEDSVCINEVFEYNNELIENFFYVIF